MSLGKLVRLVGQNASRNRLRFVLSAFGIVVGVSSFVFILALSEGVKKVVLGEIFPLERVEVIPPRASLAGVDLTRSLDDSVVQTIRNRPDVVEAVPRMKIAFPSTIDGYFKGVPDPISLDMIGDGVASDFLAVEFPDQFKDWETEEELAKAPPCSQKLVQINDPDKGTRTEIKYSCEGLTYCDMRDKKCHHRVPLVISRNLLEIYNKEFAKTRGLPVIGAMEEYIVSRGGLDKMRVYITLGRSMVSTAQRNLKSPPRVMEGTILGLSDKAIPIGITVPAPYVRRWNAEFVGPAAAAEYSSIVVRLEDKDDVGPFGAWLIRELNLRLEDSQAERFAWVILGVTILLLLISFIIVAISAINIAHNLFMQVSERRKEIGVLRAIGATRTDIAGLVVGEAALIGLLAGVLGVACAVGAATVADWFMANHVEDFPFKPDTLFDFKWWIWALGLGFSMVFCVLGGAFPARKAANMQPAAALAQQ